MSAAIVQCHAFDEVGVAKLRVLAFGNTTPTAKFRSLQVASAGDTKISRLQPFSVHIGVEPAPKKPYYINN